MRQASEELTRAMENGTAKFYQEAHIVFADGAEMELGKSDFYLSGNGFSDGPGTNALALGEAMAKSINAVLVNDLDQLSEYDFNNARITVWCCADLSESTERLKIGTFTVGTPVAREGEIEITGIDDMHKGDADYNTSLAFPATAKQILLESCQKCGVVLKKESFTNDNFMVLKKPTQCTHRTVWGMVAMLAGGNARMDEDNRLEIISYDLSFFARRGLDGGRFDNGEPLYQTGDTADGGNFLDYSSGDAFDGGNFEELGKYHMFYRSKTPTIDTDDIVIAGVQVSSGDASAFYGSQGYVLTLENQLISGRAQEGAEAIGELTVGMRFRPFTVDHTAYPLAEFGDICYVFDRKGNHYQSVVTDIGFSFYGYTTIKCAADSAMRSQSEYKPAAAGIIAAVEKQTDEKFEGVDRDIENINEDIGEVNENLNAEIERATQAESQIGSRINIAEYNIDLEVRRAKGAEETLSGRISITESNIDFEVRRAKGVETELYSRISLTESSITAEVSRATQAEGQLSSRISITADQISTKVTAGEVTSLIEQNARMIRMKADAIVINSTYFSVDQYGVINAQSGTIGPFSLTSNGFSGPGIYITGSQMWVNNITARTGNTVSLQGNLEINDNLTANGNVKFAGVYYNTTSGDANVHIGSAGNLSTKSGSSRKWKHGIGPISDMSIDPHRLYNTRTYEFIYNDDYLSRSDHRRGKKIPGFIIENLEKDYPIAVDYDKDGNLSTWSPSMFIAPFLVLLQEQNKEINKLKKDNKKNKRALNALYKSLKEMGGAKDA